ncbi:MAG: helix-turn-helix transcriptional regulator [Eubacterium sp.]|nr:helix-turn-helix transcriptional regulator [Eubacterium sp.]
MKQIIFGNYKNVIGNVLAKIRLEQRITQTELAARMQVLGTNIDQQMISKIEKNQRQVTDYELACFCKCLNISPEKMLEDFYKSFD